MNAKPLSPLLLILAAAILFLSAIGTHDLWPADEPRFAEVPREMMVSGDYLVPRVNGMPYKEKPPLLFWCIAAASQPFGEVNAFTARLPSALGGILTILCTFVLAERLYDRRTAFWASLIIMTCQRFWWQALTAQIDMLLTTCMAASLLFFWLWHSERRRLWLALFYGAITAGVYAKGPPALVFPLLLVFTFYWRRRSERKQLHLVAGLAAVIVLIALWLVPARIAISTGASGAAQNVLGGDLYNQIVGRFLSGGTKAQPPWYYLINLPVDWLPWSLFLPWTLPWIWKHRKDGEPMRLLLAWTVPAFIFFSICVGKRATYLLPLAPALAIFFSRSILELMESARRRWRYWTAGVWATLLLIIGAAPFAMLATEYRNYWNAALLGFSLLALGCGLYTLYRTLHSDPRRLHVLIAAQFAGILLFSGLFVLPAVDTFKSARDFCAPLRTAAARGSDFTVLSLGFSREEYIFYARYFHQPAQMPIPDPPSVTWLNAAARAELCQRLWERAREAVRSVDIANFSAIGKDDVDRLQSAVAKSLGKEGDPTTSESYLQHLTESYTILVDEFAGGDPKYIIVQDKNWRLVVAAQPSAAKLPVLRDQPVGSRHVLLIANGPAAVHLAGEAKRGSGSVALAGAGT